MNAQKLVQDARQTQSLTLEQIQSMKVLQLSRSELIGEAELLLNTNPLVERTDGAGGDQAADDADTGGDDRPASGTTGESTPENTSESDAIFDGTPSWGRPASASGPGTDPIENVPGREDVREEILVDLRCMAEGDLQPLLFECLVDELDEHGFITTPVETLALEYERCLAEAGHPGVPLVEWRRALFILKHRTIPGLGASGPAEALTLQTGALMRSGGVDADTAALLEKLLDEAFTAIITENRPALLEAADGDEEALEKALAVMKTLSPHPVSLPREEEDNYVVPDVVVRLEGGRLTAQVCSDGAPSMGFVEKAAFEAARANLPRALFDNHLAEARLFMKAVEQRRETLGRISNLLVERQAGWFTDPSAALEPLSMSEAADALGVSPSTVSRAVAGKFVLSPRGMVEMKNLFSSARFTNVDAATGEVTETSADAVLEAVKAIIAGENPAKPFSDQAIADRLAESGLTVARRTVAKYRESAGIPSTRLRRRA